MSKPSKRLKGIVAVVLALACVLPMPVSGQTAGDTGKIDEYLLEKMEQYTGELPVYICVQTDMTIHESLAMEEQEFNQMAEEFRQEIRLEDDNLVLNSKYMFNLRTYAGHGYIPLTTAWLTREEIRALAGNERIARVTYIPYDRNNLPNIYYPFRTFSFNAEMALFLLQISVGLHDAPGEQFLKEFDVDRNGQIDAYDALLILQESVGLIAIGEVMTLYTWQSTTWSIGAYDWERIPPEYIFCANDVNGDGVADSLDIMIQYRDMWR